MYQHFKEDAHFNALTIGIYKYEKNESRESVFYVSCQSGAALPAEGEADEGGQRRSVLQRKVDEAFHFDLLLGAVGDDHEQHADDRRMSDRVDLAEAEDRWCQLQAEIEEEG